MTRRVHCTNHCGACGTHFHSTEAFDRHRAGAHEAGRHCIDVESAVDKHGALLFTVLGSGSCDMRGTVFDGVRVWTLAAALERARTRVWGVSTELEEAA